MSKIDSNNPIVFLQSSLPSSKEGEGKMTITAHIVDSFMTDFVLTIVKDPTPQRPWGSVTRQTIAQMDTKLFFQMLGLEEAPLSKPETIPQRPAKEPYRMPHLPRYQKSSAKHAENTQAPPPSTAKQKTYHIKAEYQFINKSFTANTTDAEILGLQGNFTARDLKVAYNKLSLQFHPDKHEGSELAKGAFQIIREAYERLKEKIG